MTKRTEREIPKKVKAAFALSKLSRTLQSDVLSNEETVRNWGIPTERTLHLADDLTCTWQSFFAVFRAAVDGTEAPPLACKGKGDVPVAASIDADGSGLLEVQQHRYRFPNAALMSSHSSTRLDYLDRILLVSTVHTSLQKDIRSIVAGDAFSINEFISVASILSSSPEELQRHVSELFSEDTLTLAGILPGDSRFWDNLTAPLKQSTSLSDFIKDELSTERLLRIDRDPVAAFRTISLAFSSPALVERDLFQSCNIDTRRRILNDALLFNDHFSLIGSFELCTRWIADDHALAVTGEQILDLLFGDMAKLEVSCGVFCAAFILSTAKIAEDDELNSRPTFWKRLSAGSLAQLLVRSFDTTEIDHGTMTKWSMQQCGLSYFLSSYNAARSDPRWRPDWIFPRFLIADVCGRAITCFATIPEALRPKTWQEKIEALQSWVYDNHYGPTLFFPAIMEGARIFQAADYSFNEGLSKAVDTLNQTPSITSLFQLTGPIYAFGPPAEIAGSLHKIVGSIRSNSSLDSEDQIDDALSLICYVAVLLQDAELATAVADACMERIALTKGRETVLHCIYRLIECSGAESDSLQSYTSLSKWLEQISYIVSSPEILAEIVVWLERLKIICPELKPKLGRALALARLGCNRLAAT